jgi:hypothetical protein
MSLSGRRTFNACRVKVVEFKDFVYSIGNSGHSVLSPNPSEDSRINAGSSAVLHCPKTEDDRVSVESQFNSHPTRLKALKSLREIAGELVCRDCPFSSMDPVDVSVHRAELARAEADRLTAYKLVREAQLELAGLMQPYELEQARES